MGHERGDGVACVGGDTPSQAPPGCREEGEAGAPQDDASAGDVHSAGALHCDHGPGAGAGHSGVREDRSIGYRASPARRTALGLVRLEGAMKKRLTNRRGSFVVLFGILFMTLMGAAAMAIDMSRIWTMRNELQTAAESGALAGAVQLVDPHIAAHAEDTARVFIALNTAMQDAITADSVQTGHWDDVTQTFTKDGTPKNAVHTVVSHNTTKLIMG